MISLETRKNDDKYYLYIREWYGIDRPIYTRLFEINKEEYQFKGGRFKRCQHQYKFKYRFILEFKNIKPIIDWVNKNTSGIWYLDISSNSTDCLNVEKRTNELVEAVLVFYLEDNNDALAFKLKWL